MEERVASTRDLRDGEMTAVLVGGKKVLLAKVDGVFYATAARCPHWGGPLPEGTLHGPRLLCPWHKATYDVRSGDLLEPPSLDGIAAFRVRVEGDDVYVDRSEEPRRGRTMPMYGCDLEADAAPRRHHRRRCSRGGRRRSAATGMLRGPDPAHQRRGPLALRPAQPEQGLPRRRARGEVAAPALAGVLRRPHHRADRRARDRARRAHAHDHARQRRHADAGRRPGRQRRASPAARGAGRGPARRLHAALLGRRRGPRVGRGRGASAPSSSARASSAWRPRPAWSVAAWT